MSTDFHVQWDTMSVKWGAVSNDVAVNHIITAQE